MPPLTGIGDGFVLGNLIGHVILVMAAAKTPADLIDPVSVVSGTGPFTSLKASPCLTI